MFFFEATHEDTPKPLCHPVATAELNKYQRTKINILDSFASTRLTRSAEQTKGFDKIMGF